MNEKQALCVGIDDYFGTINDLLTCVKDAKDWGSFLKSIGFEVTLLLNSDATRYNVLTILNNMVVAAEPGDELAYTLSHHGTSVMDKSGDEPDGYDEALYVVDGTILDDELREVFDKIPEGVNMTVIADCCFSHTITRMALVPMGRIPPRIRYAQTEIIFPKAHLKQRFLKEKNEEDMKEIVLSACGEWEYAYEGKNNGAFSGAILDILKKNSDLTYNELYAEIRKRLPSDMFPQTPQLEGSAANKGRKVFATDEQPQPEPQPEPEPGPQPEAPGCLGQVIAICGAIGLVIAAIVYVVFR
jgi:hypothetical protein